MLEGTETYISMGESYTTMSSQHMHKHFFAGVPVEEIAKARGCGVERARAIINKQVRDYEHTAYYRNLLEKDRFDRLLVRLDPSASHAITMAYLQPMRGFLESLC